MERRAVATPLRKRDSIDSQVLQLIAEGVVEMGVFLNLLDRIRRETEELRDGLAESLNEREGGSDGH